MKKAISLTLLFLLLCARLAFAETAIKAEVDKTSITTDEALTYKVVVTSTEHTVSTPKLPDFKGFAVVSQAQSTTSSFAENALKSILVYAFILAPLETGKLTIEAPSITVKGKTYEASTFTIAVSEGKTKPPVPQQLYPPEETRPESEPEQPQTTL